jgi:hypothetical protein
LQQAHPQLGARLLAAPEHDHHFDLVALTQETLDVALLGAVVMRVDLQAETNLFEHGVGLVAARVAGLLSRLVLELAVIHQLGDGRAGVRSDLDQVEVRFSRQTQRHIQLDNPNLFAAGAD